MLPVKIIIESGAELPEYQSRGASGADLRAHIENPISIAPGGIELIPTGLYLEIPEGFEAQIRPRSGLAHKYGITLVNTPGTIDSDYRGEVKIIMTNLGTSAFEITPGMRIAQMVFTRVYQAKFVVTDTLRDTDRNDGGFGHSGE